MNREISPRTTVIVIVALVVVIALGGFAWKMIFRPKKANIVFHTGYGASGGTLSPRDRMAQQIYQSARTVGGGTFQTSSPPTSTPAAPGTP